MAPDVRCPQNVYFSKQSQDESNVPEFPELGRRPELLALELNLPNSATVIALFPMQSSNNRGRGDRVRAPSRLGSKPLAACRTLC